MNWLDAFAEAHRGLDEETFRNRYPHPFLVVRVLLQGDRAPTDSTTAPLEADDPGLPNAPLEILPVRSRSGDGPVFLGRSRENDLVLRSGLVSARHARFEQKGDVWTVTDLGSKNGTAARFKVLKPHEPHPLENGTPIIFGGAFQATFYTNEGLYRFLQRHYWFGA